MVVYSGLNKKAVENDVRNCLAFDGTDVVGNNECINLGFRQGLKLNLNGFRGCEGDR